jgi:N-ethylmaleimide reductase
MFERNKVMQSRRAFTKSLMGSLSALAFAERESPARTVNVSLLDDVTLRRLRLSNRMVMAPMTRGRAGEGGAANALMAEYYAQRASAGMIVTEGTAISEQGYGWVGSPGIYTDAQATAWKGVTTAVHERRGRIFLQLWHTGRVSHPDFLGGRLPIGPSAVAAAGYLHTPLGKKKPYVMPRAMTKQEISSTVRDYARAARLARSAGFDGVEIHAANGYLIDQFIRDGSNRRTDEYGGSMRKRLRFLLEVTEEVSRAWSADRVGVRLSPSVNYNDMRDSDPADTFSQAAKELSRFNLAYLHVVEYLPQDNATPTVRIAPRMRTHFSGPFILNGGYDERRGTAALNAGEADLIAYGRWFLANADLVERFRLRAPLNIPDSATFYTDGPKGYTDYSLLSS